MATVPELIAEAIAGGWDFIVLDDDWTTEVKRMIEDAGYSVEPNETWKARYCRAPEWLREEGGLPC